MFTYFYFYDNNNINQIESYQLLLKKNNYFFEIP